MRDEAAVLDWVLVQAGMKAAGDDDEDGGIVEEVMEGEEVRPEDGGVPDSGSTTALGLCAPHVGCHKAKAFGPTSGKA